MTSRITFFLVIAFVFVGHDCLAENFISNILEHCPRPFLDSPEAKYKCYNVQDGTQYCCTAEDLILKTGLEIIIPAIIVVIVVVSLVVFCISCLCCSCCPWYKRRHRGTIYGRVQTPGVVQVIQPAASQPPSQYVQSGFNPYPASSQPVTAIPYQPQPPPYTAEPYAKQAPYNPNYQQ